jgi:hypothetical protein
MIPVFADSFYFFAMLNERDPAHAKALAFTHAFRGQLLTTNWIVTELGDGLANRVPRVRPSGSCLHVSRSNCW